jgi:ABC-type bacteriocin/lantibiotic exporter with double-glycine peptidase domain
MTKTLFKAYHLIPNSKRKKLPGFFSYSFVNTILDFISLALLIPVILILLDKERVKTVFLEYFDVELNNVLTIVLLLSLISFYIIKNLVQTLIIKKQARFIYSISSEISRNLMKKFIYDNFSNYNKTDKSSFFRDVFQLPVVFSTSILNSFYTIFSELIILVVIIIISAVYKPKITLLASLFLFFFVVVLLWLKRRKLNYFSKIIVKLYEKNVKNITNILQGFIEIKSTRTEMNFQNVYEASNIEHNEQLALQTTFKQTNSRYFEILIVTGLSVVIIFFMFSSEAVNVSVLLSFFAGISIKILPSFNKVLNAYVSIKSNKSCVDLLSNYRFTEKTIPNPLKFESNLKLNNISFGHRTNVLASELNFTVQKGDFITISGKSGEGKSTLLQVMAGLLKPIKGTIELDGLNIYSDENIFNFIGYVSQQPFLFQGSVLDNITMLNNEDLNLEYVNKLIKELDLEDWLASLPDGLNSELLIESKTLSGGQKQRIALARALYFKPEILLLDESTNQLDDRLENKVFNFLKSLTDSKEVTIVAVSHNNTINDYANKRYVLKNQKLNIKHE